MRIGFKAMLHLISIVSLMTTYVPSPYFAAKFANNRESSEEILTFSQPPSDSSLIKSQFDEEVFLPLNWRKSNTYLNGGRNSSPQKAIPALPSSFPVMAPFTFNTTPTITSTVYLPLVARNYKPPLISIEKVSPTGYVTTSNPLIQATLCYPEGVEISRIAMTLDSEVVEHTYHEVTKTVSYLPPSPLNEGEHEVGLSVRDMEGGLVTRIWSFTVDTIAPIITETLPHGLDNPPRPNISAKVSDDEPGLMQIASH